jgi:hypothetical protein
MEVIRIELLDAPQRRRTLRPLWLAWWGETMPPLEDCWPLYGRRFSIEHLVSLCQESVTLDTASNPMMSK